MNANGREEIVDKLHGALAAFRRERDDLFRKKELATERLKLVSEERVAMEKTLRGMQEKLNMLNKSASAEGKQELAMLEQEVVRLNNEVSFRASFRLDAVALLSCHDVIGKCHEVIGRLTRPMHNHSLVVTDPIPAHGTGWKEGKD